MEVDQIQVRDIPSFAKAMDILPWPTVLVNEQAEITQSNAAFQKTFDTAANASLLELICERDLSRAVAFIARHFGEPQQSSRLQRLSCQLDRGEKRYRCEVIGRIVGTEGEHQLALFFQSTPSLHPPANSTVGTAVPTPSLSGILHTHRPRAGFGKDHYKHILNNTGAVIYIKDIFGRYLFINHLFEELFHVQNTNLRGKTDYEIFDKGLADQFREVDRHVLESGETLRIQEVAKHDDGLHTYISVKFPLRDREGRIIALAGISTDITDQLWAEQEINAAQAVQKLLYPRKAPIYSGFDIAGLVKPAEVASGDYYDYIWLSPTRLVVAVGDVSGHGLGPALEMVETRSYLRAILRTEVRPDVTMECLNEFLYRDLRDSAFVTLFLVDIDLEKREFQYVGAGHQADFMKHDGSIIPLKSSGLMLGIDSPVKYECSPRYQMDPGDLLLIPTDGITEASDRQGNIFGYDRMIELVHEISDYPAQEIVERLVASSRDFSEKQSQADDMTVVVIRCLG